MGYNMSSCLVSPPLLIKQNDSSEQLAMVAKVFLQPLLPFLPS